MRLYYSFLPDIFKRRREEIKKHIEPGSLVVICPEKHRGSTADATFKYEPNRNLFYLTGLTLPDTYLFLFPDHPDKTRRELLLTKYPDEKTLTWDMTLPTLDEISKITGVENVDYSTKFWSILHEMVVMCERIYLNFNEHTRRDPSERLPSEEIAFSIMQRYPYVEVKRIYPILEKMRRIKSPPEIELIRKAIDISQIAFNELIENSSKIRSEAEVEGLLYYAGLRECADGFAFPPIIASDLNSCILHYSLNNQTLVNKNLLLVDYGFSFYLYNSDITRVIFLKTPSRRQQAIYEAVLDIHNEVIKNIKPGKSLIELTEISKELAAEHLFKLSLITPSEYHDKKLRRSITEKYYPHKVGHYLGLDVHDVGDLYETLAPGCVITCEPGLYIREENTGVRIENDILITEDGCEILSASIPYFYRS